MKNILTFLSGFLLALSLVSAQDNPEPLELWEYDLNKTETQIVVGWAYPCGPDAGHFVVEKSRDLSNFQPVQQVEAICNGGLTYYQVKDTMPYNGASYYRIKMYSNVKNYYLISYSKKVVFESEGGGYFSVFPNPVLPSDNAFRVVWESATSEIVHITLIDQQGRIIELFPAQNLPAGIYEYEYILDPSIMTGAYFMRIEKGERRYDRMILK